MFGLRVSVRSAAKRVNARDIGGLGQPTGGYWCVSKQQGVVV
jgi:hypothetical protein